MRALKFSDEAENEIAVCDETDEVAFEKLIGFVEAHISAENSVFYIEDEEASELLALFFDRGFVLRARTEGDEVQEFHAPYAGDVLDVASEFIINGFDALTPLGYWFSDPDELLTELHRSEFDESTLRVTTVFELRRRLRILSIISGFTPGGAEENSGEAERTGFDTPAGDRVRAVFAPDGRGLLAIFDRTSPYAAPEALARCHEMFDGVPPDLLALSAEVAAEPVTGVVLFSAPPALTSGTFARLREERTPVEELGIDRLLGPLLRLDEFSVENVAAIADWWSPEQVAAGFLEAGQRSAWSAGVVRRDAAEFEQFGRIARAFGDYDPQETNYVVFGGGGGTENPVRDQLLAISADLGFPAIAAPAHSGPQEVWIPIEPRLRVELSWASALLKELSRAGLAEGWYRWCDRDRDWALDTGTGTDIAEDSLGSALSGFAALPVEEFMGAYARAGAAVQRGSTHFADPRKRSFTVEVAFGRVTARLEVELGRGMNSENMAFSVLTDGVEYRPPESLPALAAELMRIRKEAITHRDAPYPRPIISSRSHLEVSAREIVEMLGAVARRWDAQASRAGEIRGDVRVFLDALGAREGEPALDRALAFMGGEHGVEEFDDVQPAEKYLLMSDRGVEFLLIGEEVDTVFLHTDTRGAHREYRRTPDLVRGIGPWPTMDDIRRTLGEPVRESAHFLSYAAGDGYVQFDFPSGQLELIVVMRRLEDGPTRAAEGADGEQGEDGEQGAGHAGARETPPREAATSRGLLPAEAITGQLARFLEALGTPLHSPEHQHLIVLSGPALEVTEAGLEGEDPGRNEHYERTGVLLHFAQEILIGALIRIRDPERSVYQDADKLIDGLPLPATRAQVLERFGPPREAVEPEAPWGFDLYCIGDDRYLRFDYAGGSVATVSMSYIVPQRDSPPRT